VKQQLAVLLIAVAAFGISLPAYCQRPVGLANSGIRKLAFEVPSGGLQDNIVVIDSRSSKPRRLVEGTSPVWSPDGEKLAYCEREGTGFGQPQVINADGSARRQLTNVKGGACPTDWSPDGEIIALTGYGGVPRILVTGKDGHNIAAVAYGYGARWSPDGKQLVFCRSDSVWIANVDGSGAREVVQDKSNVLEVAWADGHSIAFSSERAKRGKYGIFRVNLDGSGLESFLTDEKIEFYFPVFSPDGKKIVVDSYPHGADESSVLLVDLATRSSQFLARGLHPSVLWDNQ
jgi:Tol biopolymer transport system component